MSQDDVTGRLQRRCTTVMTVLPAAKVIDDSIIRRILDELPCIVWMTSTPVGNVEYLNRWGTTYVGPPADAVDLEWLTLLNPVEDAKVDAEERAKAKAKAKGRRVGPAGASHRHRQDPL